MNTETIRLAYDDVGIGEPVVLLHGYPFNRTLWREQVEALKGTYRVITPDLRGLGQSPLTGEATMDQMAYDVAALLDQLGIEQTITGGLSMGGYVTLAFYRLFPQRVKALILADTRPQGDTEEGKQNRKRQAQKALTEGMNAIAEEMLPKLLAKETFDEKPDVVARVREMVLTTNPQGAANAQQGMAGRLDHTQLLSSVTIPTLIIVGSEDQLTPPEDSEKMSEEIKGSRLVKIEGAGHVSNLENPALFNDSLISFLQSI